MSRSLWNGAAASDFAGTGAKAEAGVGASSPYVPAAAEEAGMASAGAGTAARELRASMLDRAAWPGDVRRQGGREDGQRWL